MKEAVKLLSPSPTVLAIIISGYVSRIYHTAYAESYVRTVYFKAFCRASTERGLCNSCLVMRIWSRNMSQEETEKAQ